MRDCKPDRRHTLFSLAAVVSGCLLPGRMKAAPALADSCAFEIEIPQTSDKMRRYIALQLCPKQQAMWHAPFQAAFLSWFAASAERFTLPVAADISSGSTELRTAGLHPALMIHLRGQSGISVSVLYKGRSRSFVSLPVNARELAGNNGWRNTLFLPQAQRAHASREVCWREDCFEVFLDWFNNDLVPATHVGLFGEDAPEVCCWSVVRLLRDGRDSHTGRPAPAAFLKAMLPLRTPVSVTASDMTAWSASVPHGAGKRTSLWS